MAAMVEMEARRAAAVAGEAWEIPAQALLG